MSGKLYAVLFLTFVKIFPMTKSYLAITIGPIYQTFRTARHTREVWGASYLFSYIARGIILKLINNKFSINYEPNFERDITPSIQKFVLPNINSPELFAKNTTVGLFPDNVIVDNQILEGRDVNEIINQVITELSQEIKNSIGDKIEVSNVEAFLKKYLRIISKVVDNVENPILDITPTLSCLELQPYFLSEVEKNPLSIFFKTINHKGDKGFMKSREIERFESLVEIATSQFSKTSLYESLVNKYLWDQQKEVDRESQKDTSESDFIKELIKSTEGKFKTLHKYVAVVKADGDKIGQTLREMSNKDSIPLFSQKLLQWGLKSKDILEKHKAKAIFIGGDDLLFFAPIVNGTANIYELIKKLDEAFAKQNWEELGQVKPSLSFGVSITYYRFPLIEAIELADNLLTEAKGNGGNSIATQFLKHSGKEHPFILKNDESFAHFDNLVKKIAPIANEKSLINSAGYKIRENIKLIERIYSKEDFCGRIESFFINILEEQLDVSKRKPKDEYLKALRELLIFEQKNQKPVEDAIKTVFSMVRTAKFINGLDELK